MRRLTLSPILLVLLAACGADLKSGPEAEPEPAQVAEMCGIDEPVLLLPLTAEQRPRGVHSFLEMGDRLLFVLRSSKGELEGEYKPLPDRASVYAVGACGEDPRVIGPDIQSAFTSPHYPGAVFGCRWKTNDLVRLDPTGEAAPEAVHAAKCSPNFTKHGLVAYDPTLGMSFYPTLDAAAASFGEPIALPTHHSWRPGSTGMTVLADEILYIDENYDLIRLSLPDLETSVELERVEFWDISADGRFLMTQGFVHGGNGSEEIRMHDRQEGRSVSAGRGGSEFHESGSRFVSDDYALVKSDDGLQRVVKLPELATHVVPDQYRLHSPLPDGRWLAVLDGAWYVLDLLDEANDIMVTDQDGYPLTRTDEYFDLRMISDPEATDDELPLTRFFFDSAKEPVSLAPRVTKYGFVQDDGRIVTPVEIDEESGLGELVLVDPEDQQERRIDERVVVADGRVGHYPGEPDVLVYGVVDGDRTGVWAARLAPRGQK